MKVIGEPIDGIEPVMHIEPFGDGYQGVLCQGNQCKLVMRAEKVSDEGVLLFVKQVFIEEYGVGEDYKVRLVKD
ncbi:MAG: hypothetical protein M0R06_13070 [Sphaerochaeta sp.]|nr:hypothetical protein [Sphaerochaeta sp.]MDD2730599.1 hypothetical protein [Candidatus Portnoybacteria bacterium]